MGESVEVAATVYVGIAEPRVQFSGTEVALTESFGAVLLTCKVTGTDSGEYPVT